MWGSVLSILDKLFPTQKRRDYNRLSKLEELYAKALEDGHDTQAAHYRKEIVKLREILNLGDSYD